MANHKHFLSIWLFIGALLLIYGVLILGTGIYEYLTPAARPHVVLQELNAPIWWGGMLTVLGLVYCIVFRPGRTNK